MWKNDFFISDFDSFLSNFQNWASDNNISHLPINWADDVILALVARKDDLDKNPDPDFYTSSLFSFDVFLSNDKKVRLRMFIDHSADNSFFCQVVN